LYATYRGREATDSGGPLFAHWPLRGNRKGRDRDRQTRSVVREGRQVCFWVKGVHHGQEILLVPRWETKRPEFEEFGLSHLSDFQSSRK